MREVRFWFLAVCLLSSAALAQGTYTQIDYPGAISTAALGINAAGDIIGFANLGYPVSHGFLLRGGTYTAIDFKDGTAAVLTGINDLGQIVGYSGSNAFVYDLQTQTFTKVQYPGYHTQPTGINNAGTVVGQYNVHTHWHSFELLDSVYTNVRPPGAKNTYATGITVSGKVVGYADSSFYFADFSYDQGTYQRLALPFGPYVYIYGVSPSGKILVGYYLQTPETSAGFIYENGTIQNLEFPGAMFTFPYGVNDVGQVTGTFTDSSGTTSHGFTWTPPADAAKK